MEFLLFLVIIWWNWFFSPQSVGKWLAEVARWKHYYESRPDQNEHNDMVRDRAKRIRRIRNKRFKKNDA